MTDPSIYSVISKTVLATHELSNPLHLLEESSKLEKQFVAIQSEIRSLHKDCETEDACSNYRYVADDMIANITDGRFEEFLKCRPQIIDMDEEAMAQTRERVSLINAELKNLKDKKLHSETVPDNNCDVLDSIKDLYGDKNSSDPLEKCVQSMARLKSNFETIDVHENLLNGSKRDVELENKIKKIKSDIDDFNKLIEARKTIQDISRQKEDEKLLSTAPSRLSHVISGLLEEVERANYAIEES